MLMAACYLHILVTTIVTLRKEHLVNFYLYR